MTDTDWASLELTDEDIDILRDDHPQWSDEDVALLKANFPKLEEFVLTELQENGWWREALDEAINKLFYGGMRDREVSNNG